MYSTDFGHVSYKLPSVTGMFAISHEPIPGHSQQVVDSSGSDDGYHQFVKTATTMELTALELFTSPSLIQEASDQHAGWAERFEWR